MNDAELSILDHPHRRYNPLSGEHVLVSPHRALRPWQGQTEPPPQDARPSYDPACYLCPGNARANGERNPQYETVYTFTNDFAALLPDSPRGTVAEDGLLIAHSERGICRVVCFSPRHDLTLPQLDPFELVRVIETWTDAYTELGRHPDIGHVQIFENKGSLMGCSNPHPHGQIWATESVPGLASREQEHQVEYCRSRGTCLLCDYAQLEVERAERVIVTTARFLSVVPFWATWPFEVLLLPREHHDSLETLSEDDRADLAVHLGRLTTCYDNLFRISFPYSMGLHQKPTDGSPSDGLHMHFHFYPPLLRSAEVRKFMVGYEMLAEAQRDITPESAAARLRDSAGPHYLDAAR